MRWMDATKARQLGKTQWWTAPCPRTWTHSQPTSHQATHLRWRSVTWRGSGLACPDLPWSSRWSVLAWSRLSICYHADFKKQPCSNFQGQELQCHLGEKLLGGQGQHVAPQTQLRLGLWRFNPTHIWKTNVMVMMMMMMMVRVMVMSRIIPVCQCLSYVGVKWKKTPCENLVRGTPFYFLNDKIKPSHWLKRRHMTKF